MHINQLMSLNNRVAVVIGGAGKIGYPMAEGLAEAGALVYIASSSEDSINPALKKLEKLSLNVKGIKIDMSSEKSVIDAIAKIKQESGSPSILINSGCIRPMKLFMDDSIENWDKSMNVNARGIFITCRAFGKEMAKTGSGSIINISSIYGLVSPDMDIYEGSSFETEPDYPFIKGGIISFSKYMASYFAKSGVRVNVVAPGGIFNNQENPFLSKYTNRVPLGRMACSDDMKGIAVYLASDASSYVTGSVFPVDGGWTAI
jgi:NAD(P)-dependent dehydrogenase (short-subunit alcohol dehydrogenase family)